ncbi:hypothetical protein ACPV5U_19370 [Vibrio mediterranei]
MNGSLKVVIAILLVLATTMYFELNALIAARFSIPTEISSDIAIELMYCILFVSTYILLTGKAVKGLLVATPLVLAVTLAPVIHFHFEISTTIVSITKILGIILSAVMFIRIEE